PAPMPIPGMPPAPNRPPPSVPIPGPPNPPPDPGPAKLIIPGPRSLLPGPKLRPPPPKPMPGPPNPPPPMPTPPPPTPNPPFPSARRGEHPPAAAACAFAAPGPAATARAATIGHGCGVQTHALGGLFLSLLPPAVVLVHREEPVPIQVHREELADPHPTGLPLIQADLAVEVGIEPGVGEV